MDKRAYTRMAAAVREGKAVKTNSESAGIASFGLLLRMIDQELSCRVVDGFLEWSEFESGKLDEFV